ncbi:MAG: TerC family protein [Planctomycetota bacterium]
MLDPSTLLAPLLAATESAEAVGAATEGAGLFSVAALSALLALTALEIVLGVDNVVFIAILAEKVEAGKQVLARNLGLVLAMVMRIGLLFLASWVITLESTIVFTLPGGDALPVGDPAISVKDLILLLGGGFLLTKAVLEIYHMANAHPTDERAKATRVASSLSAVLTQIILLDLVFSVDSVITAVGMTDQLPVMITAVMIAVGVMLVFAGPLSAFVKRHPDIKVLALAFLVLIGVLLTVEAFEAHVPRGYVYFAMAFALAVDLVQMRVEATKARSH